MSEHKITTLEEAKKMTIEEAQEHLKKNYGINITIVYNNDKKVEQMSADFTKKLDNISNDEAVDIAQVYVEAIYNNLFDKHNKKYQNLESCYDNTLIKLNDCSKKYEQKMNSIKNDYELNIPSKAKKEREMVKNEEELKAKELLKKNIQNAVKYCNIYNEFLEKYDILKLKNKQYKDVDGKFKKFKDGYHIIIQDKKTQKKFSIELNNKFKIQNTYEYSEKQNICSKSIRKKIEPNNNSNDDETLGKINNINYLALVGNKDRDIFYGKNKKNLDTHNKWVKLCNDKKNRQNGLGR